METSIIITRFIESGENLVRVNKIYSKEDLLCIPRTGDLWEDEAYIDGPAVVTDVVFNYGNGYCTVYLDALELAEEEFLTQSESLIASYAENGWEIE